MACMLKSQNLRESYINVSINFSKNAPWTYPVACIAPGTIWGILRNSWEHGLRFTMGWGVLAAVWKWNQQYGGWLTHHGGMDSQYNGIRDIDHENNKFRLQSSWAEGWRGLPFKIENYDNWWTPREEPGWKKHVSPEEAARGPPTNH